MSCPYALAHARSSVCVAMTKASSKRNTTAVGILEQTQQLVDRMCGGNKYINGIICVSRVHASCSYIVI